MVTLESFWNVCVCPVWSFKLWIGTANAFVGAINIAKRTNVKVDKKRSLRSIAFCNINFIIKICKRYFWYIHRQFIPDFWGLDY